MESNQQAATNRVPATQHFRYWIRYKATDWLATWGR